MPTSSKAPDGGGLRYEVNQVWPDSPQRAVDGEIGYSVIALRLGTEVVGGALAVAEGWMLCKSNGPS